MQTPTGSLFWDANGRLIKGKCNFNTNVTGLKNEAETLLAAATDSYDPATAKSSIDDQKDSVYTHTGTLRNNYKEVQTIDAHLRNTSDGKYIYFNDGENEALNGYYGNILGYNKTTGVLETAEDCAKIEVTGINPNEIKKDVWYFGVKGTFSGVLGTLEAQSYIDDDMEYLPEGEYDGWNKVTTTHVRVAKTPSAPYTYYIGEIKPT